MLIQYNFKTFFLNNLILCVIFIVLKGVSLQVRHKMQHKA